MVESAEFKGIHRDYLIIHIPTNLFFFPGALLSETVMDRKEPT